MNEKIYEKYQHHMVCITSYHWGHLRRVFTTTTAHMNTTDCDSYGGFVLKPLAEEKNFNNLESNR